MKSSGMVMGLALMVGLTGVTYGAACQMQADATGCKTRCKGMAEEKREACEGACKKLAAKGACAKGAHAATVDTKTLAVLLKANAVPVLLDARSGEYDDGKRIPGALSLTDKATAEQVKAVVAAKDTLIVTYCANPKCPASARLAAHLRDLGYTNVIEYRAGIDGWVAAGHAVEEAAK